MQTHACNYLGNKTYITPSTFETYDILGLHMQIPCFKHLNIVLHSFMFLNATYVSKFSKR